MWKDYGKTAFFAQCYVIVAICKLNQCYALYYITSEVKVKKTRKK